MHLSIFSPGGGEGGDTKGIRHEKYPDTRELDNRCFFLCGIFDVCDCPIVGELDLTKYKTGPGATNLQGFFNMYCLKLLKIGILTDVYKTQKPLKLGAENYFRWARISTAILLWFCTRPRFF